MKFEERWATNGDVNLHYLEHHNPNKTPVCNETLTPIVYVPGALNFAEQSTGFLENFYPRRCVTMSLRGRGQSDAPKIGYSFMDHVNDIKTIVSKNQIENYCLLAYSMGVPYSIQFASEEPKVKGLIICDYPAKYPAIPKSWAERILARGHINPEKTHAVNGIQKESRSIELYEQLLKIKVPVLIIKGGKEGSLLKDDEVLKYKESLARINVVEITESGHELWEPDMSHFVNIIKDFLSELDQHSF